MAGEDAVETWYVRARGRILGPLSWAQLQALRERGQLARFDQVSRDKLSWVAADSLERLFPRGGSGGAFVTGPGARDPGARRGAEPESIDFLILDDEDARSPARGPGADIRTAGPAPEDQADWYYAEAGASRGPVAYSALERLVNEGRIGPSTLYWRSGLEQWTTGSDLPELNRLWPFDGDPAAKVGGSSRQPQDRSAGSEPGNAAPRVSPFAIASLVSNLFWGIGNIAAIVVGAMALRQIARSEGTLAGKRHAIAGIALGIVGLVTAVLGCLWLVSKADK